MARIAWFRILVMNRPAGFFENTFPIGVHILQSCFYRAPGYAGHPGFMGLRRVGENILMRHGREPQPCRSCAAPLTTVFADLGVLPVSNAFPPIEGALAGEKFYPLRAFVC